jgi:hypothetical protein
MLSVFKNKKIYTIVSFKFLLLLIFLIILSILFIIISKNCENKKIERNNYIGIKLENITEKEAEKYKNIIREFECYQKDYKAKSVLQMFSPPENELEKKELEFINGYDMRISPRLYVTRTFLYDLNWFLFKSIRKQQNDNVIVEVLESRTSPAFKEESLSEYEPYSSEDLVLIFEILPDKKIKKYYPKKTKEGQKYDGFYIN